MIALVTGGSGCGKSYYAERLLCRRAGENPRYYIATMDAYDDECRARVARHRAQRAGLGFITLEQPLGLDRAIVARGGAALLECLPTLLSNEMFLPGGDASSVSRGVLRLAERCADLVIVTNDVCSDGLVYDPPVEAYRAQLAGLNAEIAALADRVVEVVYSIPVAIKGEVS
jgi:adenosylcobinamide kinase/adenosylcobinamide-phosphate guanylyltransferase